jgi:hypothetical protein
MESYPDSPPSYEASSSTILLATAINYDDNEHLQDTAHVGPLTDPAAVAPGLPTYKWHDPNAAVFHFEKQTIHASRTMSNVALYHLDQTLTRKGKKGSLRIRRLGPPEARRLAEPSSSQYRRPTLTDFDTETILYTANNCSAGLGYDTYGAEIRGARQRTLQGTIFLRQKISINLKRTWNAVHITRKELGCSKREHERRIQKYGYHPDEEWEETLLFTAQSDRRKMATQVEWTDGNGETIAVELNIGDLNVIAPLDMSLKEALLACWSTKLWLLDAIFWEMENSQM